MRSVDVKGLRFGNGECVFNPAHTMSVALVSRRRKNHRQLAGVDATEKSNDELWAGLECKEDRCRVFLACLQCGGERTALLVQCLVGNARYFDGVCVEEYECWFGGVTRRAGVE